MRIAWGWVGAVVVLAGTIVGGVALANATVFSASAFVGDYLEALRTGRVDDALALPGVDASGLDERMLSAHAAEEFAYSVIGDTEVGGVHGVRITFHSGDLGDGAELQVERVGTRFGLFPVWGFAVSPVTPITVTLTGDERFQVGALPLTADDGGPVTFAALTPGVYRFDLDSELLEADPVVTTAAGAPVEVDLAIVPTEEFTDAVQEAVEADLTACAAQAVLFPAGCPFGHAIDNRVVSEPHWTITQQPTAEVAASDRIGIWAVPPTAGVAHLSVQVQSLFDGSISALEQDVPFQANYLIGFDGDQVLLSPGF